VKPGPAWLVDAHVHLHPPFPVSTAFQAAAGHFQRNALGLGLPAESVGCLMLAENEGETRFRELRDDGVIPCAGEWSVHPTGEGVSLLIRRSGQIAFVLIAGRQVVTATRLELLTLGTDRLLPNGVSLQQAVLDAEEERALAVVPWGFGKWSGRRGRNVAHVLQTASPPRLYVGDNGGRMRLLPPPLLLRQAVRRGIWNLPGSDPLPLRGEAERTGSHGFVLSVTPDLERPFAQIREAVGGLLEQPRLFGRRSGVLRFLRAQAGLRLQRHRRLRRDA
jgi:hypothetical protein